LLEHTDGKYSIVKAIWRTFAILLEYCCKTDYDSLLNDIEREYQEKQEEAIHHYEEEIEVLKASQNELQNAVDTMKIHMQVVEKEAYNERRMREKAEKEYEALKDNIESEVILRMKFEDKVSYFQVKF
jgi:chromosome segregation ATPase